MKKVFNHPDRVAKPNQVFDVHKIECTQASPKSDAFTDYQVNGRKVKKSTSQITKTDNLGRGMYIGSAERVTAFVWLDD